MSERKKVEERIKKKEQELEDLRSRIRECEVYLQALQDILKIMPRGEEGESPDTALRPGSNIAKARDALLKTGKPLHVHDLLKAMGLQADKKNRLSLSGSLAAYVRQGEIFTRPAPNTFGLVEFKGKIGVPDEPPADFGMDKPKKGDLDEDIPF